MPHLRLELPEEMLAAEYRERTGFDACALLDILVEVVANYKMEDPATPGKMIPMINKSNLKHALVSVKYGHMAGDQSLRFLHCTLAAGNDTPGRTAAVRMEASFVLGDAIDAYIEGKCPEVKSVTAWIQDIDRDRGYTTTQVRKKRRETAAG
jgi:phage FluMu protein Com